MNLEAVFSRKTTIMHENRAYDIVCFLANNTYDFYAVPADGSAPMAYMFGLPVDQKTMVEAFEMAVESADDYIDDFCTDFWA